MSLEFALYLKSRYDLVWIQWASDAYASPFYTLCRRIGLPVVHTVHNVLPHESSDDDVARYGELYRKADVLIVHSRAARDELLQLFPATAARIVESRIGLYTMFARNPAVRDRARHALRISEQQPVLLMFGGIRPYKNVDAALSALTAPLLRDVVLVVAGRESGYAEASAADPLARTRTIAERFGVSGRVRFLPGRLNMTETADLFEASDVLILPYTRSYGSAALLLGMTFGKHIAATRVGGMEEYLADYSRRTLLAGSDGPSVAAGLLHAVCSLGAAQRVDEIACAALRWPRIASELLSHVWNQLSTARRQFPMSVSEMLKTSRRAASRSPAP